MLELLVNWCFEPSQPLGVTSGLTGEIWRDFSPKAIPGESINYSETFILRTLTHLRAQGKAGLKAGHVMEPFWPTENTALKVAHDRNKRQSIQRVKNHKSISQS